MKTRLIQAAGLAVALGVSASASAIGTINFDRDGAGASGTIKVDTFQYLTDNGLMKNVVSSTVASGGLGGNTVTSAINSSYDLYLQAAIGSFTSTNFANGAPANNCMSDGSGGSTCSLVNGEFTYVLGVSQSSSAVISGNDTTVSSNLAGSPAVNFFKIYYQNPADRNQLAGTGYSNGTLVLSGTIVSNSLSFKLTQDDTNLQKLDNFGGDNRPTLGTYVGNGSAQFDINVTSQDTAFFKSDLTTLTIAMNLTTTTATPFNQANPAALVGGFAPNYGTDQKTGVFHSTSSGNTAATNTRTMNDFNCADTADALGTTTCDFQLQSQSTSAFFNPVSIPEPGSVALLGLGLGALGFLGLRRRRSTM